MIIWSTMINHDNKINYNISAFVKLYSSTSINNSILTGVQYICIQKNFASTSAIE